MAKKDKQFKGMVNKGGPAGGVFFITYLGAATYFVQQSNGLGGFIWALLKAIVWPGFLIHRVFEMLRI